MLAISVTVPVKSDAEANCHFIILPVLPLKVNTELFVPAHTVADPLMVPPTLAGLTVIVAEELLELHDPFVITAR